MHPSRRREQPSHCHRPHLIHACRILSGVDVKVDNTRVWFPSGHPAYVALKAQQEAGVGFSEHRGPMRSFWVTYGIGTASYHHRHHLLYC